jgi:hypothetical protein
MSNWRNNIIQICTAFISSVASSFIVIAIIRSDGGLTSPYRRIIFGLSASDIMLSLALCTGPFFVRTGPWSIGNDFTCHTNGVFYTIGSCSTSMYMFTLCIYSAMKVKRRMMTDKEFLDRYEKKIHSFIALFTVSLCIAGLATKSINSTVLDNICTFSAVPAGCRQVPEVYGECDPDILKSSKYLVYISVIGLEFTCLLGISACMSSICCHNFHVYKFAGNTFSGSSEMKRGRHSTSGLRKSSLPRHKESACSDILTPGKSQKDGPGFASSSNTRPSVESFGQASSRESASAGHSCEEIENTVTVSNEVGQGSNSVVSSQCSNETTIRIYRREIIIQAYCFVVAYFVTFICRWIIYIHLLSKAQPSIWFIRISSVIYPLGGFFNVIVYTRPKVVAYRIRHPEITWFKSFWLVLKGGNVLPKEDSEYSNISRHMAAINNIIAFTPPPVYVSSDVGGIYNGSEAEIESREVNFRNQSSWDEPQPVQGLTLGVSGIIDEESGEDSSGVVPVEAMNISSQEVSRLSQEEEQGRDSKPTHVEIALARAMDRIKEIENRKRKS